MLKQNILLLVLGGILYCALELLWRGRTHSSMFFCGGLCFLLIGRLNELWPGVPLSVQALLGGCIITALELLTGLLVNRQHQVWDYSALPNNYQGQICLPYFALWVPLAGLAAILEDTARLLLFDRPMPTLVLF